MSGQSEVQPAMVETAGGGAPAPKPTRKFNDALQAEIDALVADLFEPEGERGIFCSLCQLALEHLTPPDQFRRRLLDSGLRASRASELKAVISQPKLCKKFVGGDLSWKEALTQARKPMAAESQNPKGADVQPEAVSRRLDLPITRFVRLVYLSRGWPRRERRHRFCTPAGRLEVLPSFVRTPRPKPRAPLQMPPAPGAQNDSLQAEIAELVKNLNTSPSTGTEKLSYVELVRRGRAHHCTATEFRQRLVDAGLTAPRASELKTIYASEVVCVFPTDSEAQKKHETRTVAEWFVADRLSVREALFLARRGRFPLRQEIATRISAVLKHMGHDQFWTLNCGVCDLRFTPKPAPLTARPGITPS